MILETLHYDMKSGTWSGAFPALDSPRTLVTAFGERALAETPEVMKALKRAYPQSVVVGCSGSGEMVGTSVRDEVLSVTVTRFEKTAMLAGVAAVPSVAASQAVGAALAKKLNKPGLRAVFVLSDGLGVNGSELVRGFNAHLPEDVVVTGGLAGDGSRFEKTWVMLNDRVGAGLVVAVGLYGEHLQVAHGSKGGWDKFGPERVVTRSEGNVLYELDGKPALAIYKEYLGEKASGLPGTGLLFPLSLRASSKDEKNLVRTILAVDEAAQSLTFAGDVPVGHLAQLMKADFDRLVGGATDAAKAAQALGFGEGPNTLAVAVSCVGRRLVLGERTEEEVEAVMEVLPKGAKLTGFYSYGELSPYATGRCDLHNQTMTLTTFTETEQPAARVRAPAGATATGVQRPAPAVASAVPGIRTGQLHFDVKAGKWSGPFPDLDSPRTLVMAFGERALMDAPESFAELKRAYPQSVVVGCSGSGEMVGTSVRDEVLSVTVAKFGKTALAAAVEPCGAAGQSYDVGAGLAKKLNHRPGLRAVFVLSDGLGVNGSELVRGLNAHLAPEVVVTGGLAGDGSRFEKTWVLLDDRVMGGHVVAVGFYGEHLQVAHGSKGGWDKFGPERVVTRSEGNVLYELDGKPALAMYKEYLGEKASGLPGTGLLFPLSLRSNARDEKNLVRTILAVDEAAQSLTFAGDVPVGHLAQLMKADFDRLVGGATDAAKAAQGLGFGEGGGETLAVAVSCVGRRLVLGERTEEEVEAVMEVLPKGAKLAGFYSYGELSPYATGRCDLHNQTMTLTTFTETEQAVLRPSPEPVAPVAETPKRAGQFEQVLSSDSDVKPLASGRTAQMAWPLGLGIRTGQLHFDVKAGRWSGPFPELDSPRTLVMAFGERALMDAPESFAELKRAYPQSVVVGCSGSGEMVGTSVRDEVLSVTVAKFEQTDVAAFMEPCSAASQSNEVGAALAKKLNRPRLRAVFVLSDGLGVNGSELVRGLNAHLPEDVVVTGGLAGDGSRFEKTWVMLNDRVGAGLVVAVGLYGEHLQVAHGSKGGWDKFGPERVVTRSEGNVLYELDGKPALAMYKEYLGEKASGLPGTGLLFPLSLRSNARDEKNLVRTILAVDEAAQSMTFAGDVPVGYLAQLMKADFDRLVGGATDAAKAAQGLGFGEGGGETLAVAVSCVGRRLVLGERTEEEVEAVMEVLPKGAKLTGFYSYGELSPYATGRCDLHNQTMTLTTYTETARPVVKAQAPLGAPVSAAPTGRFEQSLPSGDSDLRPLPAPVFPPALGDLPPAASGLVRAPTVVVAAAPAPAPAPAVRAAPREPGRRVTRLLGADKVPSAHAVVEVDRSEDVTVVRVRGKLSETFKGREVSALAGKKLLFDLADVERITSFGVREWLQMLSELEPKGSELYFARCSEAVVNQLGMIRRFAGGGKILSFFAPYLCARCGAQFSTLLDCQHDAAALKAQEFPAVDCPSCATSSQFDDDARSYLSFGPVPHVPPPEVLRAVDGLAAIGQVDPVEKFIDGRVNRVRINARMDEALRWPRVFDGLEGDVVLELASSPGNTPGGISALAAALRRLPEDVDSLQLEGTPVSLLEALSSGKRDPRLTVGTALVEGHCASCATARPVQLRVEDATEALRNGREPYAVCKRCNAALSFETLHGLLERLAGEESRKIPREEVRAAALPPVEPKTPPAPVAEPAAAPQGSGTSLAVAAALGVGLLNAGLLGVLLLRGPLVTPPPAPAPAPVVVAPPPAPVEPPVELPPAWADAAFSQEGEAFYAVGRARDAESEEAAIAQARTGALFAVVKAVQGKLVGSPIGAYLAAHPPGDLEGNLAPIVTRLERQTAELLVLQRTDAQLKRREGKVSGPVRFKVSTGTFQSVVDLYAATGSGLGLEVGRFFPTLEASTRTEAELVVLSVSGGPAQEKGVAAGDLVLAVDGEPVASPQALSEALAAGLPGASVTLKLETAGTPREVVLTLPRRAGMAR